MNEVLCTHPQFWSGNIFPAERLESSYWSKFLFSTPNLEQMQNKYKFVTEVFQKEMVTASG